MIIYKTTNLINGKIYIGQDSHNNPNYFGSGIILNQAIKKYGKENFRKDIVEYCTSLSHLDEREIYWISCFKSTNKDIGYNVAHGGKAVMLNRKLSKKSCKKIGEALKGRPRSQETKNKIKKTLMGHIVTKESRDKMTKSHTGKKLKEVSKKKVTEALMGRIVSETTRNKIRKTLLGHPVSKETREKMSAAKRNKKQKINNIL